MRHVIRGPIGEVLRVTYTRPATQDEIRAKLGLYGVKTVAPESEQPAVTPVEMANTNGSFAEGQVPVQQVEA